ncbi:MAG: M48 family metalloprotease [Nitrospira sp.]|nr:M48 family metalloprotease [Nitrospira sp.]
MTEKRFEQLVRELEGYANAHPAPYKLKVALLAFLGYAYVLAVLGIVIALTIGCLLLIKEGTSGHALLFKVGIALIILATVIARALWVRLEPPTGIAIEREHAPRLFLLIDKIRNVLGTPAFHHVLIVNELNAAVVQVPRLGIFGWQRNYLLLGLPLMLTFTPAQFRAVLAHEFGHLGRQHGRFFSWIYRARVTWWQLLQEMTDRQHWASFVFTKFLAWYSPFFNAYSFVLAREQEYEADRNAAYLVGPHCMKDTLASLSVVGRLLEESFWPMLDQRNRETVHPPDGYLEDLAQSIQNPDHREQIQQFFGETMQEQTGYTDTHPSLADRLAALTTVPARKGDPPASVSIPQLLGSDDESAGQYYLGGTCKALCKRLNREWIEQIREPWKKKYDEKQDAQIRMLELRKKSSEGELTEEELWDYAMTTELLEGGTAAITALRQLVDRSPDHVSANFALGRLLLANGDRTGLERLEQAVEKDRDAFLSAAALAEAFLIRTGQHEEAAIYRERAMERRELLAQAEEERQHITPDDLFLPHDLSREEARALAHELSALAEIGEAYLLRKRVRVMPNVPAYVLVVVPRYPWYEWREDTKNEALLAKLSQEIPLPSNTYILVLGSQIKPQWKRKALKRIPPLPLKPRIGCEATTTTSVSCTVESPSLTSSWIAWIKQRWPEFAVVAIVLIAFSNVSAHPKPNCTEHLAPIASNRANTGTLYLVPIGEFPMATLSKLEAHYTNAWHIPVNSLAPLPLDESLWDRSRGQLIAEGVIERLKHQFPGSTGGTDVIIGVTAHDMYRKHTSRQYAFSHRDGGRFAVVSSARMHPRTLPLHLPHGSWLSLDQRDEDLAQCRLIKMVGKNIGVLYYRLPMSNDSTSLLYENIGGPDDLDRIVERF